MRVYTRVVLDMRSLEILEGEFFEYNGPVAECKGGGGATGKVEYPDFIEDALSEWLNDHGVDAVTSSVTDFMNIAFVNNPYWDYQNGVPVDALDPTPYFDSIFTEVEKLQALTQSLESDFVSADPIGRYYDIDKISDVVDAYSAKLLGVADEQLIPSFEAGMRDINAVTSSAFAIGKANIYSGIGREVADFGAKLEYKTLEQVPQMVQAITEMRRLSTVLSVDSERMHYTADKEEHDATLEYHAARLKFPLEIYGFGGNIMAGPAGGVVGKKDGPSVAASTLAGGLSGAAAGAMIGAQMGTSTGAVGWGTAIGAVVGAVAGYAGAA